MPVHRPKPGDENAEGGKNGLDENISQIEELTVSQYNNMRDAHAAALIEAERADFLKRWREKYKSNG